MLYPTIILSEILLLLPAEKEGATEAPQLLAFPLNIMTGLFIVAKRLSIENRERERVGERHKRKIPECSDMISMKEKKIPNEYKL